jgi:hypothetical protein
LATKQRNIRRGAGPEETGVIARSSLRRHRTVTRVGQGVDMNRMAIDWNESENLDVAGFYSRISRGRLMQLVFQAAEGDGWRNTMPADAELSLAVVRSVVLYALAVNLCSSEEIIESAETDPALGYLCGSRSLEWQAVHEFRRRNGAMLQQALVEVMAGAIPTAPYGVCWNEAQGRLRRAMQADSIVQDV